MTTGRTALPRVFRKLVLGIALANGPPAFAEPEVEEEIGEADRAIGVILDSMVDRALLHRGDLSEVLAILLQNMHPLDATISMCEAALSPHVEVRRVLCDALARHRGMNGRDSVLSHLMEDPDPDVRHAANRAAR